jgi:hypothetical protein
LQARREKRLKQEIERYRAENPKITEQFADLKRQLSEVRPQWITLTLTGMKSILLWLGKESSK